MNHFSTINNMKFKIPASLKDFPTIDYRTLVPFQDELKQLSPKNYTKLKNSITSKKGFFVPIYVWFDVDETPYIIDGHQRHAVLMAEKATPHLVPYVPIEAKTPNEAAEKLLAVSSQFGIVTQEGFAAFKNKFELTTDFTMNFTTFEAEPFEPNLSPTAQGGKVTQEQVDKEREKMNSHMDKAKGYLACTCPNCGHEFQISGK